MNSIQEAEFHLSLHHYFLWRVVQEKIQEQEAAVQIPPVAAVAAGAAPTTPTTTTTTTRTPAGSATTATTPQTVATTAATNTLPVGVGFQHVMPAVPDGSHRYQIMANLMLQQFPDHVTLSSTHMFSQMAATPPIVTTLYQQLPRLQVDLFAAHNRVNQLERVVRAMRVERNLILQKKKVKKKAADKAAAAAAAAGTNPTTKRKDPPTGSNQVAAVAAGTAKRPKTAAAAAAVVTETTNTNGTFLSRTWMDDAP